MLNHITLNMDLDYMIVNHITITIKVLLDSQLVVLTF